MIIEKVEFFNIGLWENLSLEFNTGVNIIQGVNGAGKTTLLALLYSMFRDSELVTFEDNGHEAYFSMQILNNEERVDFKQVYKNGKSEYIIPYFSDIKKIASLDEKKVFIFNGEFLDYDYQLNGGMVKNAMRLLSSIDMNERFSFSYQGTYISQGQQSIIRILNILYYLPQNSILLLDCPFVKVDSEIRNSLLEVMERMKDVQIILTANMHEDTKGKGICLLRDCKSILATRLQLDYKKIFTNNMKQLTKGQVEIEEEDNRFFVKYLLNQEVDEVEKRNIEYKEIKGKNSINTIINVTEIYINAFLNSHVVGIGTIKWGISDKRVVKGVKISKEEQDIITRKIAERVGQMKPYVSSDCVEVRFENIMGIDDIINELYVIEVIVKKWRSQLLISTSKGEVYIKTEGGKKKLDAYGIQEELRGRLDDF